MPFSPSEHAQSHTLISRSVSNLGAHWHTMEVDKGYSLSRSTVQTSVYVKEATKTRIHVAIPQTKSLTYFLSALLWAAATWVWGARMSPPPNSSSAAACWSAADSLYLSLHGDVWESRGVSDQDLLHPSAQVSASSEFMQPGHSSCWINTNSHWVGLLELDCSLSQSHCRSSLLHTPTRIRG